MAAVVADVAESAETACNESSDKIAFVAIAVADCGPMPPTTVRFVATPLTVLTVAPAAKPDIGMSRQSSMSKTSCCQLVFVSPVASQIPPGGV